MKSKLILLGGSGNDGRKITPGPIFERRERIVCNNCGNDGSKANFEGEAITRPFVIISPVDISKGKYDVSRISYNADDNTIERATKCLNCGSNNLKIVPIEEGDDS